MLRIPVPPDDRFEDPSMGRVNVFEEPVLIIGGGLVGLTLGQALTKVGIPCRVYERDYGLDDEMRDGWAITIHWALTSLQECLPPEIFKMLDVIQVDPEQAKNDTGRFLFLNMATGMSRYEIPPSKRMRVNRKLLRRVLTTGLEVQYSKTLLDVTRYDDGNVQARFEDGSVATGSLLVACDGANSRARQIMFAHKPELAELYSLNVQAIGTTIRMTEQQIEPLRQIDPLLFQGCHPETGVFLWYSTVSTPVLNRSDQTETPFYEGQLIVSWLRKSDKDVIPDSGELRHRKMQDLVMGFDHRLVTAVSEIPIATNIRAIRIQDWPTQKWPSRGNFTIAGDAAHAMTMFRGEAFNHGVTDVTKLVTQLASVKDSTSSLARAVSAYEDEMIARTHEAVLLSRQACLDAHDYHNLSSNSPLVSKRSHILSTDRDAFMGNTAFSSKQNEPSMA